MAADHRKNMMTAVGFFDDNDQADLETCERQLTQLKSELNSMSYERVVMDALMKQTVRNAQRGKLQATSSRPRIPFSSSKATADPQSGFGHSNNKSVATTSPSLGHPSTVDIDDPIEVPRFSASGSKAQNKTNGNVEPATQSQREVLSVQIAPCNLVYQLKNTCDIYVRHFFLIIFHAHLFFMATVEWYNLRCCLVLD